MLLSQLNWKLSLNVNWSHITLKVMSIFITCLLAKPWIIQSLVYSLKHVCLCSLLLLALSHQALKSLEAKRYKIEFPTRILREELKILWILLQVLQVLQVLMTVKNKLLAFWFPICRCWLWCISESSDSGPGPAVCCVTVSGQAGPCPWSPAPHRLSVSHQTPPAQDILAARRLTRDTYKVFSAKIRFDITLVLLW